MVRSLTTSAYIPTFVSEIGVGAIYPILALAPLALGASAAAASAAVGVYLSGRIVGSALGGRLATHFGRVRASAWSLSVLALGSAVCGLAPSLWLFYAGAVLVGAGHAAVHVSRQAQVVQVVPDHYRARALTTLAGIWRVGNFLGPVAGYFLIEHVGLWAAYLFASACVMGGLLALQLAPVWRERHHEITHRQMGVLAVVKENRRVFTTLGLAVAFTGAVRAARLVAIPLWCSAVGLSDAQASAIFALSAAVDMVLFWPAGYVMDRWGRWWTAIPSTLALGLGVALMPFVHAYAGVAWMAVLLGVGNGWGSGLLMTLGADVAPAHGRAIFTGLWMLLQDAGGLLGPAVMSLGAVVSVPTGFWAIGVFGVGTAAMLHAWIPPWRLEHER